MSTIMTRFEVVREGVQNYVQMYCFRPWDKCKQMYINMYSYFATNKRGQKYIQVTCYYGC